MSTDKRHVLKAVLPGTGRALDLGGGTGKLRAPLVRLGYTYTNADLRPVGAGSVAGDAHRLPFRDAAFALAVSNDSLEHFPDPGLALQEVRRVLAEGGRLVIWVPFLHPFHGDDYFRYTPLGLRLILDRAGFVIESLRAPLWIFSVLGQGLVEILRRVGLSRLERPIERAAAWMDGKAAARQGPNASFAAAYLVVARPANDAAETRVPEH